MATNLRESFPPNYLEWEDLPDRNNNPVTIKCVRDEEVANIRAKGNDKVTMPVVYFEEFKLGLVMNKTNGYSIGYTIGKDKYEDWPGGKVVLLVRKDWDKGEKVNCIRVAMDAKTCALVRRKCHGRNPWINAPQ